MIHKLCMKCMRTCKQESSVKIVHCPKFQKRLSDNEFHDLVGELGTMETETAELKKRVNELLQSALSKNDDFPPGEDEPDDSKKAQKL